MIAETVGFGERSLPENKRQPENRSVGREFRDMQRACVEQVHVRCAVRGIVAACGDELVDVIEALVVAEVDRDAAVFCDDVIRAFVFEATESGAFFRNGLWVERIDFDDPAETVGLVRLFGKIEAIFEVVE